MANIKSAAKRARQNEKRYAQNRILRSSARTAVKNARVAMESGDVEASKEAVHTAEIVLDKAASKGVIHSNNASRRKGRLAKALHKLQTAEPEEEN